MNSIYIESKTLEYPGFRVQPAQKVDQDSLENDLEHREEHNKDGYVGNKLDVRA